MDNADRDNHSYVCHCHRRCFGDVAKSTLDLFTVLVFTCFNGAVALSKHIHDIVSKNDLNNYILYNIS